MKNIEILSRSTRSRRWLPALLLMALVVAGLALVPSAEAQSEDTPTLTVLVETLKIRSGPGFDYPPFDTLTQGTTTGVIGYNAKTGWWQVVSRFGSPGWISGDAALVSVNQAAIQQFISPEPGTDSPAHRTNVSPAPLLPRSPALSPPTLVFQTNSGGQIYAINDDGSNLRYLTTGIDPALSPDGQQVAFTRWNTSQDGALGSLWLINVDGTGERLIHENVFNPRTPVWSPDGSQIVIGMQQGGRVQPERLCGGRPPRGAYDISRKSHGRGNVEFCYTLPPNPYWGLRLVDVVTGAHEDLPRDIYSFSPAWDPLNPNHLIYDGDRGLVNLNLADNTTWAFNDMFNDHSPVYSPDGSKIALSHWQSDHWDVHVMNADGSGRTRLTQTSYIIFVQQQYNGEQPHSFNNAAPTWSPDGSQIAFLTDRTGQWEIWVMNADGSHQRPMFSPETLAGIPIQYNGVDERMLSWR